MAQIKDAMAQVYEWWGKPGYNRLPPDIVLAKMNVHLGEMQKRINIGDRTIYLDTIENDTIIGEDTYPLTQAAQFGTGLLLQRVDQVDTIQEQTTRITMVARITELQRHAADNGIAAIIIQDPDTNIRSLKFQPKPTSVWHWRLTFEPGPQIKVGVASTPNIGIEWVDLLALKTAESCGPDVRGLTDEDYKKRMASILNAKAPLDELYQTWIEKEEAGGNRGKIAFNESRRRLGPAGLGGGTIDWSQM